MKIRKVKWNKDPVLGDLELNLVKQGSKDVFNTVIIAGENGTGKTRIINTISAFLNQGPITPFEFIEYQIGSKVYRAMPIPGETIDSFFRVEDLETKEVTRINWNKFNNSKKIYSNLLDPRHYGCAYTRARANYEGSPIKSTSTNTIDSDIYKDNDESDATKIKQLLVDVYSQDGEDVLNSLYQNPQRALTSSDFELKARISRFRTAFNSFFEGSLSFDRLQTKDGEKKLLFKKYGRDISIDDLSTGESQIVYRGAYLLKNAGKLNEGIIFVDEPEMSMHIVWQFTLVDEVEKICSLTGARAIIATHSPQVLNGRFDLQVDLGEQYGG